MDIKFRHTFPIYKPQWVQYAYCDAGGNIIEIKKELSPQTTNEDLSKILIAKDIIYDS